jgi:hypothetical protein
MIKESVMPRSERGHFVVAADARPERRGGCPYSTLAS